MSDQNAEPGKARRKNTMSVSFILNPEQIQRPRASSQTSDKENSKPSAEHIPHTPGVIVWSTLADSHERYRGMGLHLVPLQRSSEGNDNNDAVFASGDSGANSSDTETVIDEVVQAKHRRRNQTTRVSPNKGELGLDGRPGEIKSLPHHRSVADTRWNGAAFVATQTDGMLGRINVSDNDWGTSMILWAMRTSEGRFPRAVGLERTNDGKLI